MNYLPIKRALDLLGSLLLILLLLPVMLVTALFVAIMLGRPVLFRQRRPGLREVPFTVIKFRSMNSKRDNKGNLLPDDLRLTKFGRLLRKTSLDELPQLFNVLVGDMSFVGPRPLLMEYLPLYSDEQKRRHNVRPGITGWAQVNGRNILSWEQKFALDVWYVDNISLLLDIKIVIMTLRKVLKSEGISAVGHATTEKFRGANNE